jgi:hypothetical protein
MSDKTPEDQYSEKETAERFERALKKAFLMPPLHQAMPNTASKKKISKTKPKKGNRKTRG